MDITVLIMNCILILLGVLFTAFGYLIYFKNKYSLINNFKICKNNYYALRIGLIEFCSGMIFICMGTVGFFIYEKTFSIASLIICIAFLIIALIVNSIRCQHKQK